MIEFLGLWEMLHNFDFKPIEFEGVKNQADANADKNGNMRDYASINELLVLANLESYNAILIKQGKSQKERMVLLRELVMQQLQTLVAVGTNNLSRIEGKV